MLNQPIGSVSELADIGDSKSAVKTALMLSPGDSITYGLKMKEAKQD